MKKASTRSAGAKSAHLERAEEQGLSPDSITAKILALSREIARKEWKKLPRDGSYNLDHYLYGAPKKR